MKAQNAHPPSGPTPRKISSSSFAVAEGCELAPGDVEQLAQMIRRKYEREHGSGTGSGNPNGAEPEAEEDPLVSIHGDEAVGRCAEESASEADKCKHWAIGIIAFVTVAALAGGLFLAFYFGLAGAGKGEPGVGLGGSLGAYGPFQEADPDGTKRRPALDYPEDRSLVHFWPLEPLGGGLLNQKFGLNDNRRFGGSEFRRGFGVRFHVGTFLEQETPSTSSNDADEQDQRPRAPSHDDRFQYRPAKESQLFLLDTGGASVNYLRILEGGGGELDGSGDEEYKSSTTEYLHWDDMPAAFKSEHNSNYGKLKQTLDEHQLPIVCGRYGNGDVAGIPIRDELVIVGAGSSTTTSRTHQKSQSNSKFAHALQLPDVDIGTGGGETESASAACSSDELYRGIEMFKLLVLDGAVLRANGRTNLERVRKLTARLMQRGPPERKSRSTLYQGTGTEGQFVVQPLLDDDTCPPVSFNPFSPRNDAYRKRAGRGFQHEHEELVLGGHGAGSSGAKQKWRVAAQIVGRATGDAPVQRLGDDESLDVWLHGVWWFRTFFPFRRELLQNFRRLHEPKPSDEKNSDESKQDKMNLFASLRLPMIAAPSPQHEIDIMQGNLGLGFLADRAESEHWPDSWPIMLDYFAMDYYAKKFQLALGKGGSAAAAVATATTWSADQDSNKVKPVFAFLLMDQATQQWLQQPLFVLHAAPKEEDVIRFPLAEELNWNRSKFSTMTALWHAYWYDRIVLHAGTETAQNKQCREWQEALRGPSYRVTGAKRKEANAKQHLAKTDRWQERECLKYYSPLLASGGASSSRDAGAAAAGERSRDPRRAAFHPANEGHAPVAYSPAIYAPLQKLRDQIAAYGRKIEKIEKGENLNRKRREELTDLRKQRMRLREKYAHREWQTVMTRNVVPSLRDTIGFAPTHWQLAARRIKIGTTLLEAKVEKLDYANTKAPEHKPSTMFLEQPLFWKMAEENEDDPERLVQDLPGNAKYLEEYREEQKRHAEQKRGSERAKRNGNEEVREQWQKKEAEALRVRESIRKMLLPHVGRRARKQELRMNPKVFRSVAQALEAEAPRVTPAKEARKPKLRGHGADAAAAVQESKQRECDVDRDSSGYKLIFDTGWSMLSLSPELYDYFLDQIVEKDADGRRIVLRTVEKDPSADEIEFYKAERAVLRREQELRREMREEERMKLKASAAGAAGKKGHVAYGYESEEDDDEDGLPLDPSEDEADIRKKYRRRVPTYKYRSCLDGPDVSFELVKQNPYPEKNEYFWYNIRPRDYCYCERMEGGRVVSMHSCIAENTHIARLREPTTMPAAILGLTWHRAIGTSYDYVNREMILPKIGLEWPEN